VSEQCAYTQDGIYAVNDLRAECRGLREDIDNLLAATEQQRKELADLRRFFGVLRARVDQVEIAVPA
jgi:predicted RNA-binding Zn ribbon-like protein